MKIRRIKLQKLKNTRDLGGFIGIEGRKIKDRMLIRSGALFKASADDINKLCCEYGLRTIIDLRIDAEIKEKPDPVIENVSYIRIPLLDKAYLGITRDEYSIQSWFNLFSDSSRRPEDVFYDMYEMLVFGEKTKAMFRQIFSILLSDNSEAVLWHCSAGKDRVGVTTMLILLALGVDRETIIEDFLATNRFSSREIIKTRFFAPLVVKDRRLRKCLAILMGVKREYMDRLFSVIDSKYSSSEEFLMTEYGITEDMLYNLREKFLD